MSNKDKNYTENRVQVAMHLQDIENNPLDADQIAMFKMFELEGWTAEQRLEHIRKRAKTAAKVPVVE